MRSNLGDGETVIREGRANLQRGAETVGGRLYLTRERLIFESHGLNIQTGATVIPLSDVAEVGKGWTKFLGVAPLTPNAIELRTRSGESYKVTCSKRAEWIAAIDEQRGAASG